MQMIGLNYTPQQLQICKAQNSIELDQTVLLELVCHRGHVFLLNTINWIKNILEQGQYSILRMNRDNPQIHHFKIYINMTRSIIKSDMNRMLL